MGHREEDFVGGFEFHLAESLPGHALSPTPSTRWGHCVQGHQGGVSLNMQLSGLVPEQFPNKTMPQPPLNQGPIR